MKTSDSRTSIPRKPVVAFIFLIAAALLLGGTVLDYWVSRIALDARRRLVAQRSIVEQLDHTVSVLREAEMGQRGFLLTGREYYLEPYDKALAEIPANLDRLRYLVSTGDLEAGPVGRVVELTGQNMAELRQEIQLRRQKGLEAALAIMQSPRSQQIIDLIRSNMAHLRTQEDLEFRQAAARAETARLLGTVTFVVMALLNLGFLGWAYRRVSLDIRYRMAAERALRESQLEIEKANQVLEQRVAERTAEAEHRATLLQQLTVQLTQAEQRERQRLAQVLHDHLQQLLVGAKFNLSVLRGQLPRDEMRQTAQQVEGLLDESLAASRSLTVELSPPVLFQGTFRQVLEWLGCWMKDKHGLTVKVDADEQVDPKNEEIRILLFQSVRELLFNVVKHAKVSQVSVRMVRAAPGRLEITIVDKGAGFDPASKSAARHSTSGGGFGLFSVRQRLELLGGSLTIDSHPGQGTCVMLTAPC